MRKITFLILIFFFAFSNVNAQNSKVPFSEAKRYFVINDYPEKELHTLKITDEDKFNSIFGMATVMGKNGQPTPIDFSKNYVIALIDSANNVTEELSVKSLTKNNDILNLVYNIKQRKEPNSASFRYSTIIVVDKKYGGTVSSRMFTNNNEPMVGDDLDEYGCKPSTGFSWSILKNECIQPWETKYVLESDLNYPLLFSNDNLKAEIIGLNHFNEKYQKNIILDKSKDGTWKNKNLILVETKKDHFVLKEKNKQIIKGKLR